MKKRMVSLFVITAILSSIITIPHAAGESLPEPETAALEEMEKERAEMEKEREEMEKERAEMEKEREEMERQREEQLAAMGLSADTDAPRPTRPPVPSDDTLSVMSSEYSEIVYISTVDELRAIDGHDGGYYELENDIDISGIEWTPLKLTNATFNGNGFSINGLTVTREPGYKINTYGTYIANVGLFDLVGDGICEEPVSNIYILNLNLSDINIDITKNSAGYLFISGLGFSGMYCDNCKTSGNISVTSHSGDVVIYGIYNGEQCENNINIMAETDNQDAYLWAYGIVGGSDNQFYGSISSDDWAYGIDGDSNNYFEGDITAGYGACGIGPLAGNDNIFIGDVRGESTAQGICNGKNNYMEGDVIGGVYAYGIKEWSESEITNCIVNGNIIAENGSAYGIDTYGKYICTGCSIYGNVTGNGATGISGSTDCSIYGNVTANNGYAYGIYSYSNCTDCSISGNVTANNGDAYGIYRNCSGCSIYGNVTANNGDAYGIRSSSGCYISGTITESPSGSPTLSVTASSPYQGFFRCGYCKAEKTSKNNLNGTFHCYSYYTDSNGNVHPSPHYYSTVNSLLYDDNTVGIPPESEGMPTAPPTSEPAPSPTPKPATYTVQIVDEQSEAPIAGAEVTIGGKMYSTDDNGVIVLKDAPRNSGLKVEYGGSVIYTDASFNAVPNQMSTVHVKPLNLEKEDLFAGNNASTRITGPEVNIAGYKFPVFDVPFDMECEFCDALKVAYNAEDKTFQVLIGGENELSNIAVDANSTSW
ncbi:MAG: hypothetical protein ACI38A_01215, partial [Candidatus Ornithomonoglobus sp.]